MPATSTARSTPGAGSTRSRPAWSPVCTSTRAGKISFEKYATKWEGEQIAGEAGTRITDNALRVHLIPALGSYAMVSVRRSHIQALFKKLSEQLGPGSVRNVYDVLVRVMTAAVEDKVIAVTPCKRITLPSMPDEEFTPLTVAQVEAMLGAMLPYIRAAIIVLAGSGLRIGASSVSASSPG